MSFVALSIVVSARGPMRRTGNRDPYIAHTLGVRRGHPSGGSIRSTKTYGCTVPRGRPNDPTADRTVTLIGLSWHTMHQFTESPASTGPSVSSGHGGMRSSMSFTCCSATALFGSFSVTACARTGGLRCMTAGAILRASGAVWCFRRTAGRERERLCPFRVWRGRLTLGLPCRKLCERSPVLRAHDAGDRSPQPHLVGALDDGVEQRRAGRPSNEDMIPYCRGDRIRIKALRAAKSPWHATARPNKMDRIDDMVGCSVSVTPAWTASGKRTDRDRSPICSHRPVATGIRSCRCFGHRCVTCTVRIERRPGDDRRRRFVRYALNCVYSPSQLCIVPMCCLFFLEVDRRHTKKKTEGFLTGP